jgi:hypothetical protein
MARRRVLDATVIQTPSEQLDEARERIFPVWRSWALSGGRSLEELVLSVYLQGAMDGWQAHEMTQAKAGQSKQ